MKKALTLLVLLLASALHVASVAQTRAKTDSAVAAWIEKLGL